MKELTHWSVELFSSILIDKFARIFSFLIKPMSDIGACSFDDGLYLLFLYILLYESGKVVDLTKERNPDVIGMGVSLEFREIVESSFMIGFWELFVELVFVHQFQFLINRLLLILMEYNFLNYFIYS